jgi:hypothetical protein
MLCQLSNRAYRLLFASCWFPGRALELLALAPLMTDLSHNKSLLSDLIYVPANFLVIQRAGAWEKA